jgi:YHS domain-containing protein
LIKLLVTGILIYLVYKIVKTVRHPKVENSDDYRFKSTPASGEDLVEDPVCHTYVPLSQAYKKEISGKTHYFCSQQCSDKYVTQKNN